MSVAVLETALSNAPGDALVLAAYADALTDAGDPRGEFLRLQAALDAGTADTKAGEVELRRQWIRHKEAWVPSAVGRAATVGWYPLDGDVPLARVRRLAGVTGPALLASPVWWLLRGVWVEHFDPDRPEVGARFCELLARSRVKTFRVDGEAYGVRVLDAPDGRMLRTEGDDWVTAVLDSGLFDRLAVLALPGCGVTDAGAELLAAHPRTPRLRALDLDRNHLSHVGVNALAAVGVMVSDRQHWLPGGWDFDPPGGG